MHTPAKLSRAVGIEKIDRAEWIAGVDSVHPDDDDDVCTDGVNDDKIDRGTGEIAVTRWRNVTNSVSENKTKNKLLPVRFHSFNPRLTEFIEGNIKNLICTN